jgi:GNAT superfamily N-acetyltransferase
VTQQQVVTAFIRDVQAAADGEKEALGFLPAVAYGQAVGKGEITLVLEDHPEGARYAGHIWISGTYPHARVVQLCVRTEYRGQRLATRLLRAAIQAAEDLGYLSIKANVADDLVAANRVYEHHGFEHAQTKLGSGPIKRIHRGISI